ncbi:hypothetical protein HPB49_003191 [Dermacentor silvarum]|uniref:Uncharacterized protein n=1 Tax=Dermacentor silvarum TaxID=543639 RepID=A0ACB8DTS7_DERSI|nr:hypothetical protein HPB49_003191 [Dermacentor silvarum]
MHQQPDVPGGAMEAAASQHSPNEDMLATPQATTCKCPSQSSKSVKLIDTKECGESVSVDVPHEPNIVAEGEGVDGEPERKAPTESAVVDIVRRLEEVLQEKGPCQEGDLMGALSLSQAQVIIQEYGTLTAFIDQHPAFRVVRGDVCFVYYKDHENEDACHCLSLLQDGVTIPSACYNDGGRQHAEVYDDVPRRARLSSSSSSNYESAVEELDGEHEECSMKDGWSQVSSPPALQAMQEMCNAESQIQGGVPAPFIEMESTLQKRDSEIAKLKGRLKTLQESHSKEEQDLLVMIDELLQMPRPDPARRAAEVKNPISKIEKPTGMCTNEEDAKVSPLPPRPRPLLPERHPLPLARPEDKRRSLPVDPSHRPQHPSDKELSTCATSPLVPDFSELPGSKEEVAASCSVESMQPSKEEGPTKTKVAQQISKIVRMVKKTEPTYTDEELRRLFDHVRRSHGGFSRMTFKAIVELLLDNLKAARREED